MKAIRIHEHGTSDVLKIDEIDTPKIQPDEVLIRVKRAALNHLDLWVRRGIPGIQFPHIQGSDAAGTIEEIGSLAERDYKFNTGDEVIAVPFRSCGRCPQCYQGRENLCTDFHIPGESIPGVQAEYIAVPARYVMPKPKGLDWDEAAALPLASLTAYHMLKRKVDLRYGQWILIYGASSGVGGAAIQIAKAFGAKIITTAGSSEKAGLAKNLGADYIINYQNESISRTVKEITAGRGVDVVFEHTGRKTWVDSLRSLSRGGRLVTCGATTGPAAEVDIRALFIKHQQIIGSTMGTMQDMHEVMQMARKGDLSAVVSTVFSCTNIKAAHDWLEEGKQFGKVVVSFDS